MRTGRKYLFALSLLTVLAVVFGVVGTVAPPLPESELAPVMPQQGSQSDSVAHFQNPPTYDSGWVDIGNKTGQYFALSHQLNSTDVVVDITGRTTSSGGVHRRNLGLINRIPGWSKTYGRTWTDEAYSVIRTLDGGYALAGYTDINGANNLDFWLVKTDAAGNVQWNRTYGGANRDAAESVVQMNDGSYALAGYTYSYGVGTPTKTNLWLVKTDAAGNAQWNKTYGGADNDSSRSLIATSDGGFAIAGESSSFGSLTPQVYLVKTDSTGILTWNRTYGGASADWGYSVVETSDGGYACAGLTYSFGPGTPSMPNAYLVKTDADGIMVWNKTYGGESYYDDRSQSVVATSDGGYALFGSTQSYGVGSPSSWYNFWLVKTDAAGNAQWNRTYGGSYHEVGFSMVKTDDGGYAIAGYTMSYGAGSWDFWLVKTDPAGNHQWNKTYGGVGAELCRSVVRTVDGGYALAGYTYSYGVGTPTYKNFWLTKTDIESGGLAWTDSDANSLTLYKGADDLYWNYVRIRIWLVQEPTWIYGDINMDGVVDAKDLYILGRNYGQTFSLLSLGGIIGIAGIRTVRKRKQAN